jgi:hypothetical protein
MKKLQEMVIEDEKQRIPVAQGLPWTTDEPEVRPFLELVNRISGLLTFNVSTIMSRCSLQTKFQNHMKKIKNFELDFNFKCYHNS